MKAVVIWELLRRRGFMIYWSLGISVLVAVTVLAYLSFKSHISQINNDFSSLTNSAGSFFGGTDFFSPVGYLSSQIYFILLPILLIIMVVVLASGLMNRDENDLTVELTLARPISRLQLLGAKALAGLIVLIVVCAITYGVMELCVSIAGLDVKWQYVLLTHVLSFAFAGMFGVIAFALMAFSRLTRPIASVVAIVLSFGGYVISSMGGYLDIFKQIGKGFPYHYYDTAALLSGKVDRGLLVYIGIVVIVCVILACVGYRRRDIG
jgi:ABC-2 type transport system permease protein